MVFYIKASIGNLIAYTNTVMICIKTI